MGAASSRAEGALSAEIKSLESVLASLGTLPALRTIFSHLSSASDQIDPQNLKECFELGIQWSGSSTSNLNILTSNLGISIVELITGSTENRITWLDLLKGFEKFHQPSVTGKLKLLFRFFYQLTKRSELPVTFRLGDVDNAPSNAELSGHMTLSLLQDFLWLCWLMGCDGEMRKHDNSVIDLPNVEPLVKAAQKACSVGSNEALPENLQIENLLKWMLVAIPGLATCLVNFIQAQLNRNAIKIQDQDIADSNREGCHVDPQLERIQPIASTSETGLLSSGVAWAIGLSQPDAIGYNLVRCSFFLLQCDNAHLLYRSSIHGKGMNRFWAHLEGYQAACLMLIEGNITCETDSSSNSRTETWLVGALLKDGFQNKTGYYGSRGSCIFALQPLMQPIRATGNGSNYVYSNSHVKSGNYLQQQRQTTGIGFGGDFGKERLWLDEDFMQLTVRHHAVDKTYEHGYLLPNQGYGTVQAKVLNVEVWGLGGAAAIENQVKVKERTNLFTEQKRKVDLQSMAANWSDSPEKMMMDMVSDPNRGQREDR